MLTFYIHLKLQGVRLTGLRAVDFCRVWSLDEVTTLYELPNDGGKRILTEVDESFARLWFDPSSTSEEVSIYHDMLMPGEMTVVGQSIAFVEGISDARMRELFIAGRFRELKNRDVIDVETSSVLPASQPDDDDHF